ncbi:forkhead box protein G1-like [Tachyglossus aculeatus]|uniref:forkhead box protein G1-like n=1 Tax=Tachyglossus aculeatus TaxID=9261 RepID=UPI0018F59C39|nr:forkhead box protein G1-like [Tachyglossus aculeatus]
MHHAPCSEPGQGARAPAASEAKKQPPLVAPPPPPRAPAPTTRQPMGSPEGGAPQPMRSAPGPTNGEAVPTPVPAEPGARPIGVRESGGAGGVDQRGRGEGRLTSPVAYGPDCVRPAEGSRGAATAVRRLGSGGGAHPSRRPAVRPSVRPCVRP